MVEKVVLLISTGRTGTKSLAELFDNYFEKVESYHQPRFSRVINVLSNMYVSGVLPEPIFEKTTNFIKKNKILNSDKEYYVEANTMNYVASKILKEIKKEVYIIHIIRDPRDFVRSYINWKYMRFKSHVANSIIPFWHPSGYFYGDYSLLDWLTLDEFEKMCWFWKVENNIMLDLYQDEDYFKSLKFEDIFLSENKEKQLREMIEFVGLSFEEKMLDHFKTKKNKSKKEYFPKWQEWNSDKSRKLKSICGDLMTEYGYGREKEWIEKNK